MCATAQCTFIWWLIFVAGLSFQLKYDYKTRIESNRWESKVHAFFLSQKFDRQTLYLCNRGLAPHTSFEFDIFQPTKLPNIIRDDHWPYQLGIKTLPPEPLYYADFIEKSIFWEERGQFIIMNLCVCGHWRFSSKIFISVCFQFTNSFITYFASIIE